MKPRIFLGSSANHLNVLRKVESYFADTAYCKLWTSAFAQNKSNLDSLERETKLSDFSILLAMKDDILTKKGEEFTIARDNVIFEFALFLGSTGLNRAFLLAEERINLPSDLDGITISKFTMEPGKHNSLENICEGIKQNINTVSKGSDLGFLPSTALAIGYYYNFIKRVCEAIHTRGVVVEGEKENARDIKVKEFKFHVIIPDNLDDNGVQDFKIFYNRKHELKSARTVSVDRGRGHPFVFKLEPPEQKEEDHKIIHLHDVPDTLNTIVEALKLYMPQVQVGQSDEVEHLEHRELANFAKVLKYLITKNTSTRNSVIVTENVAID
jgi:hypothetical protein